MAASFLLGGGFFCSFPFFLYHGAHWIKEHMPPPPRRYSSATPRMEEGFVTINIFRHGKSAWSSWTLLEHFISHVLLL
ncbi:hypothetical protein D5086_013420 [Populus alba]|uniref:Uncharacterized protein n=1 Tax=Populus alba TaxID=43335 RepID=A0ACC4C5R2_POPAL